MNVKKFKNAKNHLQDVKMAYAETSALSFTAVHYHHHSSVLTIHVYRKSLNVILAAIRLTLCFVQTQFVSKVEANAQ